VARSFQGPAFLVPRTLLKAIRIHQWAKNILLFLAPLLLSHKLRPPASIGAVIAAFFCFSFMASANYLVNDLLDIENDRRHPAKRFRPFAAGDLPVVPGGLGSGARCCIAASAALAALASRTNSRSGGWRLYIVATTAYSFYLKRVALVDVLDALRAVHAAYAGRRRCHREPRSPTGWLASPSFCSSPWPWSSASANWKTCANAASPQLHGRGYLVADLEQIRSFGTASATAAVVVFHALHRATRRDGSTSTLRPAVADCAPDALLALPGVAAGLARRNGRRPGHLCPPRPGQPGSGSVRAGCWPSLAL
jgi:hypothetical protein